MDDADCETEVLGVLRTLESAVTDREMLVPHPLETEVGVGDPEVSGPGKGRVGELAVREGGEGRVDPISVRNSHAATVPRRPIRHRPPRARSTRIGPC